ncbi:ComF family protein [Ancylobacter lacus]|uniref:ComF family protein n=1 Tax=Ancylobacter lacus TaxID=2579970 RepID=UPI001BCD092B|nr:ComF family protein [Ancylobacter lacus]MBS7541093.1 ComF family protein [Ancylobacter lacus]
MHASPTGSHEEWRPAEPGAAVTPVRAGRPAAALRRVLALAGGLGRALVDGVLPPLCVACRADVDTPGCLCGACWSRIPFIAAPLCDRLGTPFDAGPATGGPGRPLVSPRALADPPAYGRARAVARYDGVVRDLVHGLKYGDRLDIAPPLARLMAGAGAELLAGADALVPVPLHARRLWRRRFNQSALLAQGIARESGVPVRTGWLERRRATAPQVGLERGPRAANVAGAFAVPAPMAAELRGRRLVLVDDVLTTGATLDACTKALLRAGAGAVDVLVFARVVDGPHRPIS